MAKSREGAGAQLGHGGPRLPWACFAKGSSSASHMASIGSTLWIELASAYLSIIHFLPSAFTS